MATTKQIQGCALNYAALTEGQTLYFVAFNPPTKRAPAGSCDVHEVTIAKLAAKTVTFKNRSRAVGYRAQLPRRDHDDWRWVATTVEDAVAAFRERTNEIVDEIRERLDAAEDLQALKHAAADKLAEGLDE